MPSYTVLQPIKYDGDRYQKGTVEMPEKVAKPLVADGVLRKARAKPNASSKGGQGK